MTAKAFSEVVSVSWYEHDCEWLTKYCDEEHRRTALVPRDVLAEYETHPCGHSERTSGCGGCDPGAIEYVIDDTTGLVTRCVWPDGTSR